MATSSKSCPGSTRTNTIYFLLILLTALTLIVAAFARVAYIIISTTMTHEAHEPSSNAFLRRGSEFVVRGRIYSCSLTSSILTGCSLQVQPQDGFHGGDRSYGKNRRARALPPGGDQASDTSTK